jgi:glutamate dehydrogenase
MVDDLLRPRRAPRPARCAPSSTRSARPGRSRDRIVRLFELNGAVGLAMLGRKLGIDEVQLTRAYTKLGEALGLDWAQNAANTSRRATSGSGC